jgi:hypothetical protein
MTMAAKNTVINVPKTNLYLSIVVNSWSDLPGCCQMLFSCSLISPKRRFRFA